MGLILNKLLSRPTVRRIIWICLIGITSAFGAYSLAARYTNFLMAPRTEKILLFFMHYCLACIITILIFILGIIPLYRKLPHRTVLIHLTAISAGIVLLYAVFYRPPPFPEHHQLTITALEDKNHLSEGSQVEIKLISTVSFPDRSSRRFSPLNMEMQGSWHSRNDGYGLFASEGLGQTLRWNQFMQGGIRIEFLTGPRSGKVRVDWDDDHSIIDLYSSEEGRLIGNFEPPLDLRKADSIRKILIAGVFMADFWSLLLLVSLFSLTNHLLILNPPKKIEQAFLLVFTTAILLLLFIGINLVLKPVVIENPRVEAVIREALDKPTGDLYQRDLRMVVQLDASNQNLSSLDGLELLVNLRELNLRNNRVEDLTTIGSLRKLEKIDLENNRVKDLSPIVNLDNLKHLNLSFNTDINSLETLRSLKSLKTLLLTDIHLGDKVDILENLHRLSHLNVRNTGIINLEIIGQLENLEYLNLYANSGITDLSPLLGLKNLKTLMLADIPVSSQIRILAALTDLEYLNLRNTQLQDITPLSNLTKLTYLNLHSNPDINSIEPIMHLTNLQSLILRGVPVGIDINVIKNFTDLRYLNVRNTNIKNVEYIGFLMSKGLLQDQPDRNIAAGIDIRDNPLSNTPIDQFAPVRPYWENITDRRPIGLPFHAQLPAPAFSFPGGFYDEPITLEITPSSTEAIIYYTLDGSDPDETSRVYSQPIPLSDRSDDPDVYSAIQGIAAYWRKPDQPVTKATVVRAVAIHSANGFASPIATQTYFIGPNLKGRYGLPIVSLVSDPVNFFDDETGIYVLGIEYDARREDDMIEDRRQLFANYNQRGREWERPIHIEVFEPSGERTLSQNGGVRIHGSGSRRYPQKSMRFYARTEYDLQPVFDEKLFPNSENVYGDQTDWIYQMFLLRNSGQDWKTSMLRDIFAQRLVQHTNVATQQSRFVIVFLNGEYWGLYNLQERYDAQYLFNHYRIDPDDVVILREKRELEHGNESDVDQFVELRKFIQNHDLSDLQNYDVVASQVDIDNFLDYQIFQIVSANIDWPHNNQYLWRKSVDGKSHIDSYGHDGRWRYMMVDLDISFGLQMDVDYNMLVHSRTPGWGSFIFNGLLENENFRQQFVVRFCDHLNSTFSPQRVTTLLDETSAEIRPAMEEFYTRWDSGDGFMEQWEREIDKIRSFASQRPETARQQLQEEFNLAGTSEITIVADYSMGSVAINAVDLGYLSQENVQPQEWKGIYFNGIPVEITAKAKPGYQFIGWEGIEGVDEVLMVSPGGNFSLVAVFLPEE